MDTRWFRHVKPEDQENFKATIRNSRTALDRLKEIITDELRSLDNSEMSEDQFEDPNWPFKQSYRNGQRSKIKSLLNLLDFDPK